MTLISRAFAALCIVVTAYACTDPPPVETDKRTPEGTIASSGPIGHAADRAQGTTSVPQAAGAACTSVADHLTRVRTEVLPLCTSCHEGAAPRLTDRTLLAKPAGVVPHGGGAVIAAGSREYELLSGLVVRLEDRSCEQTAPSEPVAAAPTVPQEPAPSELPLKDPAKACETPEEYFARVERATFGACVGCHAAGGVYGQNRARVGALTDFLLDHEAVADRFAAVTRAALAPSGTPAGSLLVAKPLGELPHAGGTYESIGRTLATLAEMVRTGASCAAPQETASDSNEVPPTESPSTVPPETPEDPVAEQPTEGECLSTKRYFRTRAWRHVFERCVGCHETGKTYEILGGTRFILRSDGASDGNYEVARAVAHLADMDQTPTMRSRANGVAHGGGVVVPRGSEADGILAETIRQLRDPEGCDAPAKPARLAFDSGLILLDPSQTLRKATLRLAGRIPTGAEEEAVRDGGLSALDPVLRNLMREPAFFSHLETIMNDLLLTDASTAETRFDAIIKAIVTTVRSFPLVDPQRTYSGFINTNAYNSMAIDAIAREPVKMASHIVRNDRPFTEILTARYRLVNRLSAQVYKLDVASLGFTGDERDFDEFVEAQIPSVHGGAAGEYAGLITTQSFLFRYPNSESNRNRKRARYFYKLFMDFDITKKIQVPIDLSQVDFTASPWRNNAVCVGCHALIDPVAGMFQNWSDCSGSAAVAYLLPSQRKICGREGWFSAEDMFAPGSGPHIVGDQGGSNKLLLEQKPRALEVLAAATASKPEFARAIAAHFFTALTGARQVDPPEALSDDDLEAYVIANGQIAAAVDGFARTFTASGYDLKAMLIAIVKGLHFRAAGSAVAGRLEHMGLGGAITTPEVLHDKIVATVGYPWSTQNGAVLQQEMPRPRIHTGYLMAGDQFRVLGGGGIDSLETTERASGPTTLHAVATERMAREMACRYAAVDFTKSPAARAFFPHVEKWMTPTAAHRDAIVANLQHMFRRFLGVSAGANDPEIVAAYDLLAAAWQKGRGEIAASRLTRTLRTDCQARTVYATQEPIATAIQDDADYVIRAWHAVIVYLLTDYRFLYD